MLPPVDEAAPAPPIPTPRALSPLESAVPVVELALPGYLASVVSLPLQATTRKPVVVAVHGKFDRAEWQCDQWRAIVGDRAFVLCPRGTRRPDYPSNDAVRQTFSSRNAMFKEVDAALEALRNRYSDYADDGPVLYVGFSLGAIEGVPYIARDPARFSRAALVEGGHDAWSDATIKAFSEGGGRRILFACGQVGCNEDAKRVAAKLEKSNVETRVIYVPGEGHSYGGKVAEKLKDEWNWLVEGDERWR